MDFRRHAIMDLMADLPSEETKALTVEARSDYGAFFLEDRAIQNGWHVSFSQHPKYGPGWFAYRDPIKTLAAWETYEVGPLLDQIDRHAQSGLFAAGFVSFDAAPAFDAAFTSQRLEGCPLACFHVYEEEPRFYKELICTRSDEELAVDWRPEMERERFLEKCRQVKHHLAQGDTYQVNLSLRFHGSPAVPLASLFADLAAESPPPYASLFLSEQAHVASLSPELFFERAGSTIRCRPMKGTAPVGSGPAETAANIERLRTSEKDRAENLMILDMIRNDLGRIAKVGTVRATSIFEVEAFPTVLQMTSTVEAELTTSLRETFDALFPCASIVGAPKVATMEIIHGLEDSPRGAYSGAIGAVLPGQAAKFAVAIRTIFHKPGGACHSYGAGSGIVWDSEPEAEWRETLLKTEALRQSSPEWSLIETFRWPDQAGGDTVELHLDRMSSSARSLGVPFDRCAALRTVQEACEHTSDPLRVRLLLTYGGRFRVESEALATPPGLIRAKLASMPVQSGDPSLRVKTNRRGLYNRRLAETGAGDAILWNERREVTETCNGNIVAKIGGQWITPPLECGLLPGVLRAKLLATHQISEGIIPLEGLAKAEELHRINSLTGWIPIRLID